MGKRIVLFSYGSGLAATMFSIRVKGSVDDIVKKANILNRLAKRTAVPAEEYISTMKLRESSFNKHTYKPTASTSHLASGTYYLTEVSAQYQRLYTLHN